MSDIVQNCLYCASGIVSHDDYLQCTLCKDFVHVRCLKRRGTPGDLVGDVFFTFTCCHCTNDGNEIFIRQNLPWLMVVTLAIYNLSIKSKGLSHHGHYHWRTHIANFIEKNWSCLFPGNTRKKKKWIGTIAGTLSHHSPEIFVSGQELFQETGWWKLVASQKPKYFEELYEQIVLERAKARAEKKAVIEEANNSSDNYSISASEETKRRRMDANGVDEHDSCRRTIPFVGKRQNVVVKSEPELHKVPSPEPVAEPPNDFNTVQSSLMDFLAENLSCDGLLFNDEIPTINPKDGFMPMLNSGQDDGDLFGEASPIDFRRNDTKVKEEPPESVDEENLNERTEDDFEVFEPRIVQVTNFQQMEGNDLEPDKPVIKREAKSSAEESDVDEPKEEENDIEPPEKSLFTKTPKRKLPWLDDEEDDEESALGDTNYTGSIKLMSVYEEKELYHKLRRIINMEEKCNLKIPLKVRRLYRKLFVRDHKRQYSRPIFNIDTFGQSKEFNDGNPRILDRYHLLSTSNENRFSSFYARIAGSFQYEVFASPYTGRILHPFIYRNSKCFPEWLKVMCEVQHAVSGSIPSRCPIDFCYVRPNHIAAVNALLQTVFWPGIDMSECLSYPDFSVVALYKKLVVGCAFLVPDVGFNEAYISFMAVRSGWQRSGIASFMLYHLIQTCMSKDITLHVSATNPAVCLYQKFGFKIEEVILDFYDKYLPIDSKHSRHAFFLRLKR